MEIRNETQMTYQQLAELSLKEKSVKKTRYVFIYLVCLTLLAFIAEWLSCGDVNLPLLILVVPGIGLWFYYPITIRKTYKKMVGEQPSHYTFLFRDDEVDCDVKNEKAESHTTYQYAGLSSMKMRDGYIFLYTSPYHRYAIDINGFASESEKDQVVARLKERVKVENK